MREKLVPTRGEQKMLIVMNYRPAKFDDVGTEQAIMQDWRKFRDYLESKQGAELLLEITLESGRREAGRAKAQSAHSTTSTP